MSGNDSAAAAAYLKSLAGGGMPSQKEIDRLERINMWEELIPFCEEMESAGGGVLTDPNAAEVDCQGYGRAMSPGDCLSNQLSPYCLPGFPCHTCEERVTISPPNPLKAGRDACPTEKGGEIEAKVGYEGLQEASSRTQNLPGSGAPSLKRPKTRKVKAGVYDPKTMTRSVARDLGLL